MKKVSTRSDFKGTDNKMKVADILKDLEAFGDERTKNTLMNHGAREPFFCVRVGDLKKILKKTKKITNYPLRFMPLEIQMQCIWQPSWQMKVRLLKLSWINGWIKSIGITFLNMLSLGWQQTQPLDLRLDSNGLSQIRNGFVLQVGVAELIN